ncbi:MAG: xanthine dehydrogenase family protein molybdopterin-binding subunit, partial [Actinomycetota bacterium]|nr:xanthine dehydrogenase family protein molybdopterin-binding subunit [Actinomycetota bacterium]
MSRLEDPALLTGSERFLADLSIPEGCLHAAFVRSPMAHACVGAISTTVAAGAVGVVAVETAATLGLGPFVLFGSLPSALTHRPIVDDLVRQVGDPVAMVLADSPSAAADAVDLVEVDFEPLEPIVRASHSAAAKPLYQGHDNAVFAQADGGPDPLDGVAGPALVVEMDVVNHRVASCPIEADGILVVPDPDGGLDVWCTSQGVQDIRDQLLAGLADDRVAGRLRVRSPAVGGGFGGRATAPPEFVAVARAALLHRRPVHWVQSRYENLLGMAQGRDYQTSMRVAVDPDGVIRGMDVDVLADAGSWAHMSGLLLTSARRQVPGMYRVPAYRFAARAVLTNTPPVGAYRGAGQPEANHARERVLDVAARRLGIDPIELRVKNLPAASEFPFASAGGFSYDAAAPVEVLRATTLADVDGWRVKQATRRAAGDLWQLGIGVAVYAQTSGRGAPSDSAIVTVRADGSVLVACASPSHGQGHRTTWAALVSKRLGVEAADVQVVDADTALVDRGQSTGGSRSTQVAASALVNACGDILDVGRVEAAQRLEAAPADLVVVSAGFGLQAGLAVAGVPTRRVTWSELAGSQPSSCLEATRYESVPDAAYPYGTHVSVVEVDPETGFVRLLAHTAVDDCGVVLQPQLVE